MLTMSAQGVGVVVVVGTVVVGKVVAGTVVGTVVDVVVETENNEKNKMQYEITKTIWSQRINLKNNGLKTSEVTALFLCTRKLLHLCPQPNSSLYISCAVGYL